MLAVSSSTKVASNSAGRQKAQMKGEVSDKTTQHVVMLSICHGMSWMQEVHLMGILFSAFLVFPCLFSHACRTCLSFSMNQKPLDGPHSSQPPNPRPAGAAPRPPPAFPPRSRRLKALQLPCLQWSALCSRCRGHVAT
ncbi:unnamed protein product [Bubo scandiacus]